MRAQDIVVGESYRHKDHPDYCWAKVLAILKPKQAPNPHNRIVVSCEWSVDKDAQFGLVKYFNPADLVKP
jgi:hypothetical protein